MPKLILLPLAALMATTVPANAAAPEVAKQVAPEDTQRITDLSGGVSAKATAPEEKRVCKQLPWTGSRMSKRACLTAKEWKELADNPDQY